MSRVDIVSILIFFLFLIVCVMKYLGKQKYYFFVVSLFLIVYTLGLLWFTLFSRTPTSESTIRIIPHFYKQLFRTYYGPNGNILRFQIGPLYEETKLNVLLFIPFGLLIPEVMKRIKHLWGIILSSLILSIMIESFQLFFHLGWFDIDDILMNLIGTLTGYFLFMLLCCVERIEARKKC